MTPVETLEELFVRGASNLPGMSAAAMCWWTERLATAATKTSAWIRHTSETLQLGTKTPDDSIAWLAAAERVADFHLALDWNHSRSKYFHSAPDETGFSNMAAWSFFRKGMMISSLCASYAMDLLSLYDDELDTFYIISNGEFDLQDQLTYAHEFVHALQDQYYDLDALDRADDLAGGEVHVVVAAQVARVVVRDALFERRLADVEATVGDQLP